jgi:hypothetical protein
MPLFKNNRKKRNLILIIISIVFVAILAFIFSPKISNFLEISVGPPPDEPEARKAWISENIKSMDKTIIVLNEKLPSWKELDQMNQSLPSKKNYPRFIKAIQTYNTLLNLVEVLYFSDVLKDLGINTQFIHANYWLKGKEFKLWYFDYDKPRDLNQDQAKRALVHNILLAKQQGLAVILFPDYYQLENGGMKKLNISDDLEERLETIALELAEIAEEYNVEYLVPSNQIEMILESNDYSIEEAQKRTNAFYASIVPKIRQIYSGKIMYKMGGFGDWSNYEGISLEGADIFGFTGCYNRNTHNLWFITHDIKEATAQASKMSQKYNIPWFSAEFVASDDPPPPSSDEKVSQILPIEDYYKAGLEAFDNYSYAAGAVGFTVHSLLGSGKVYDTPAMPLIKEFFTSKP